MSQHEGVGTGVRVLGGWMLEGIRREEGTGSLRRKTNERRKAAVF